MFEYFMLKDEVREIAQEQFMLRMRRLAVWK